MIEGFETETAALSEREKDMVALFVEGFKNHVGANRAVTAGKIAGGVEAKTGIFLSGPRVRKIINHIRLHGLVPNLIATSRGYYVATSQREIIVYIRSLDQRIGAIQAIRNSLVRQANGVAAAQG